MKTAQYLQKKQGELSQRAKNLHLSAMKRMAGLHKRFEHFNVHDLSEYRTAAIAMHDAMDNVSAADKIGQLISELDGTDEGDRDDQVTVGQHLVYLMNKRKRSDAERLVVITLQSWAKDLEPLGYDILSQFGYI